MKNLTLLEIYNNNWDGSIPGNNDKGSNHSYIEIYERLLSPYRDTNCKVLEIGVAQGYSLRMWNQYFNKNLEYKNITILDKHNISGYLSTEGYFFTI